MNLKGCSVSSGSSIGKIDFFDALAGLLNREYGWPLSGKNIAVVSGSQTSCFLIFNMLSGRMKGGGKGRILLPLMPEYIGYADQTIDPDAFVSCRPGITDISENIFKYSVDFERLDLEGVSAIAASRPTNPTGNVLTDEEVNKLSDIAAEREIPLILDNAYGMPFPGIIFEPVKPVWSENIILSMSLSKIGLPATRTGIIIASEKIINAISALSAVATLAPAGIGQDIALPLIRDGSIMEMSRDIVMPFYRNRSAETVAYIKEAFGNDIDYSIHKSEGAIFLWIWFKKLETGSLDLYNRLKMKGVIIVPGDYFFYGLPESDREWPHRRQCIRLNYSQSPDEVRRGIDIIAGEIRKNG